MAFRALHTCVIRDASSFGAMGALLTSALSDEGPLGFDVVQPYISCTEYRTVSVCVSLHPGAVTKVGALNSMCSDALTLEIVVSGVSRNVHACTIIENNWNELYSCIRFSYTTYVHTHAQTKLKIGYKLYALLNDTVHGTTQGLTS